MMPMSLIVGFVGWCLAAPFKSQKWTGPSSHAPFRCMCVSIQGIFRKTAVSIGATNKVHIHKVRLCHSERPRQRNHLTAGKFGGQER